VVLKRYTQLQSCVVSTAWHPDTPADWAHAGRATRWFVISSIPQPKADFIGPAPKTYSQQCGYELWIHGCQITRSKTKKDWRGL